MVEDIRVPSGVRASGRRPLVLPAAAAAPRGRGAAASFASWTRSTSCFAHPPFDRLPEDRAGRAARILEVVFAAQGEIRAAPRRSRQSLSLGRAQGRRCASNPRAAAAGPRGGGVVRLPLADRRRRPEVDVIAEEECLLIRIPEETFHRWMTEQRGFGEFFLHGLTERLRLATDRRRHRLPGTSGNPIADLVTRHRSRCHRNHDGGRGSAPHDRRARQLGAGQRRDPAASSPTGISAAACSRAASAPTSPVARS